MEDLAKLLIVFGVVIILIGGALLVVGRVPFIGRLPGDITLSTGGLTCFFPLATSIILSLLLTLLLNILFGVINR